MNLNGDGRTSGGDSQVGIQNGPPSVLPPSVNVSLSLQSSSFFLFFFWLCSCKAFSESRRRRPRRPRRPLAQGALGWVTRTSGGATPPGRRRRAAQRRHSCCPGEDRTAGIFSSGGLAGQAVAFPVLFGLKTLELEQEAESKANKHQKYIPEYEKKHPEK